MRSQSLSAAQSVRAALRPHRRNPSSLSWLTTKTRWATTTSIGTSSTPRTPALRRIPTTNHRTPTIRKKKKKNTKKNKKPKKTKKAVAKSPAQNAAAEAKAAAVQAKVAAKTAVNREKIRAASAKLLEKVTDALERLQDLISNPSIIELPPRVIDKVKAALAALKMQRSNLQGVINGTADPEPSAVQSVQAAVTAANSACKLLMIPTRLWKDCRSSSHSTAQTHNKGQIGCPIFGSGLGKNRVSTFWIRVREQRGVQV